MPTLSRFDRGALPPARSFYEKEFGGLRRASRDWARTSCPFHQGSNKTAFSVNLQTGGFFCFSCGAKGGDLVDYVMQRDSLDFKRAAQSLGAWRSEIEPAELQRLRQTQQERERQRAERAAQKERERQQRINARDWLHSTEKLYEAAKANDDWDLMSLLLPEVREGEQLYWQAAGFEVRHEH
jgi:phage/plasmid primase-like uncharacterized protein